MQNAVVPMLPEHGISGVLFDHAASFKFMEEKLNSGEGKEKWQEIVGAWRASGLGKAEFCKKQKVAASRFYYWCRKLEVGESRKSSKTKSRPKTTRKSVVGQKPVSRKKTTADDKPAFVEISIPKSDIASQAGGQVFRITTSYGAVMEIPI